MQGMVKVNFCGKQVIEFPSDTTLLEVSQCFQKHFNYPILVAKVDNDVSLLSEKIAKDCVVEFYDRSTSLGNSVYGRSLQFILILAVKKLFKNKARITIEYSIDKGFYCELHGIHVDLSVIEKIQNQMCEIVKQDLIFTKVSVSRLEAMKYFQKKKQLDKVAALRYISNTYVNLYRLDDIYDYFYGRMAYSTKDITDFELTYIKDNGFVVCFPDIYNPECTLPYKHHEMVFNTYSDYIKWADVQAVRTAADLNQVVSTGKICDLIRVAEIHYNTQLMRTADEIYRNRDQFRIVAIAGPSSSGKTTTAKKLSFYLKDRGLNPYSISVDDYFLNRDETPKDKDGNFDLESIRAIDLTLFNQHLTDLLDGKEVLLPQYNFVLGKKEYKGSPLKLDKNDIIIIEGLHALNEDLTPSVERDAKYKIYVCPLTQLNVDHHNRIHASDIRKLRRIIRDNQFRGYNARETLIQWKHVREGEEVYVFPFQDEVNIVLNTALIYEIGVLKTYAEPLLFSVNEADEMYPEALRLINFLRNFLPIPSEDIPKDSILREFIGGSDITY